MPRARMVKPDIWTDEKFVQLRPEVALLFIGMLNFADDEGWLIYEPERIRLQVRPNDVSFDAEGALEDLVASGMVRKHLRFDGSVAIQIFNFLKHQKVSHPSKSVIAPECSRGLANDPALRNAVAHWVQSGAVPVKCRACGRDGVMRQVVNGNGSLTPWFAFVGVEIDSVDVDDEDGFETVKHVVFACRDCIRRRESRRNTPEHSCNAPEDSGGLANPLAQIKSVQISEQNRTEGLEDASTETEDGIQPGIGVDPLFESLCRDSEIFREAAGQRMPTRRSQAFVGSSFRVLRPEHLTNVRALVEWHSKAAGVDNPIIGPTRAHLLLVLCAAHHATHSPKAESPVGLFASTIAKKMWRPCASHVEIVKKKLEAWEREYKSKIADNDDQERPRQQSQTA